MDTEKENKVRTLLDEKVPSTPGGQVMLKRTRSIQSVNNGKRLPLASKDNNNNRSSSYLLQKGKIGLSNNNNNNNNNNRKFKKYGSVLGYDTGSRVKSLVLKDIESGDEKSEEEDEEENPLAIKLKNALKGERVVDQYKSSTGLLSGKKGLSNIFNDKDYDREIEYAPEKPAEKEYVPDGYEPFTSEELTNLYKNSTPFGLQENDEDDEESEVEPQPMKLIPIVSTEDDSDTEEVTTTLPKVNQVDINDDEGSIELEAEYDGRGLSDKELLDLLD